MTDAVERPFVGRDEQLQRLVDLLPGPDTPPRTVLLMGDEGSGRAELVARLQARAGDRLFLRWRFTSADDGVAALLRLHAGTAAALARGEDVGRRTLERLRTDPPGERTERQRSWIESFLTAIEAAKPTQGGGIQLQLPQGNPYWGLLQLLLEIPAVVPTVLEFQQLNAVTSPAFWAWFLTLRREVRDRRLPVTWIVSAIDSPFGEAQDDPLPTPSGLLHGALSGAVDAALDLPPLDDDAIGALLDARYQPHALPPDMAPKLRSMTDGNPGHLDDLLELLEREEIVVWDDQDGFQLTGALADLEMGVLVPPAAPEGELEGGPEDPAERAELATTMLRIAAVEGRVFTAGVVAGVLDLERDLVDDMLDALPDLVEEDRFHPAVQSWTYRFRQALFHRHHLLGAENDRTLHKRKMARILLDRFVPANPAYIPLAAGLFRAGGLDRQARNLLALAMGSDRLDLGRSAQEVIEIHGTDDLPGNLLRLLFAEPAERAVNASSPQVATELIERLSRWAESAGDGELGAFAQLLRSRVAMRLRDLEGATEHAQAALGGFANQPVRRAETLNQLAMLALHRQDPRAAKDYLDQARKASTIPPVKAYSVFIRGLLRRGERKVSTAADAFAEAARLAIEAGNPLLGLEARLNQGEMLVRAGRAGPARKPLELARTAAQAMQARSLERSAAMLQAQAEASSGNAQEAFDLARDALALGQELDLPPETSLADHYHCGLFGLAAGHPAEAREHLAQAAAAMEGDEHPLAPEIYFHLGEIQARDGDLESARDSLARSRELALQAGDALRAVRTLQGLGFVDERTGDRMAAIKRYEQAIEEMTAPAMAQEREALRRHLEEMRAEN